MINNDKMPFNENQLRHGYWERYIKDDILWYRGNYINGKEDGYWEVNDTYKLIKKIFYII